MKTTRRSFLTLLIVAPFVRPERPQYVLGILKRGTISFSANYQHIPLDRLPFDVTTFRGEA